MNIKEITPTGPVHARVRVPGSKSITNRALVCAALAEGDSFLSGVSDSDDTALMSNGLNQLGVLVRKTDNAVVVSGTGGRLFAPKFPIPVGNAGTTFRFLLAVAGLAEGKTTLETGIRMSSRPNAQLFDALGQLGVKSEAFGTRCIVHGGGFAGGTVTLKAEKSSQFLSSLLMVAPYARNDVNVEVDGKIASLPYVDLTMEVMREFGITVDEKDRKIFSVKSGQKYKTAEFHVEADASGASYFLAAAAIAGGEVMIEGLKRSSQQGDMKFLDLLERMGCKVREEEGGKTDQKAGKSNR